MPVEITTTIDYDVIVAVNPTRDNQQPADIDGNAIWTVSNGTVVPIDAKTAKVTGAAVGDCSGTVICDADLGTGVVNLSDTFLIHFGHPMATSLGLTAEPVLREPAA